MPPRKSDGQRKSDVSTARPQPKDDVPVPISSYSSSITAAAPEPSPATTSAAPAPAASTDAQQDAASSHDKKDAKDRDTTTIEDLSLPKSIITRLAKGVLPANTQIQANAILAMSKSTTVFVNYLASHANEHTTNAGKKTIAAADVFKALDDVEFGFLRERLEAEFAKYNAIQTEKRTSYRNKVKAAKQDTSSHSAAAGNDTTMADTTMADTTTADTTMGDTTVADTTMADTTAASAVTTAQRGEDAPRAKKPRVDPAGGTSAEEQDDAETEEEEPDDEEEEEDPQGEDDEGEENVEGEASGDETQDALEEKGVDGGGEEPDEALDGDDSD